MRIHDPSPRISTISLVILPAAALLTVLVRPVFAVPQTTNVSFLASRNYGVGQNPLGVTVGDFNGDGKSDLATANEGSDNVSVLINSGNGTYLPAMNFSSGSDPVCISIGDFNGDGKLDIVVLNRVPSTVSVLLGNGDGTFQAEKTTAISTGNLPDSLAIGDFNSDGKLDVAVTVSLPQIGQRAVAVLLGNGDGTFQVPINYDSGSGAHFAIVADFNADGRPDIAVADSNANAISVLLGKGDGTFQAVVNTPTTLTSVGPLLLADFNHDAKVDILMAALNGSSDGQFHVFPGNGDGSFKTPLSTVTGAGAVLAVAVGDVNGDGMVDVLAQTDGGLITFLGKGDGTFVQGATFLLSPDSRFLIVADLDGDGKADLASVDGTSDRVSVAFGNGDGTFQAAPVVPFGTDPISPGAFFVRAEDMNGDGILDLIADGGARGNGNLGVFLGKGDGSFQAPAYTYSPSGLGSPGPIAVGDLNLDGKPDVVVAIPGVTAVGVLIGNGDGTFQPPVSYGTGGSEVFSIGVGDFNGDGKPDAIAADNQGNLYLFEGTGDGTFGFAKTISTGSVSRPYLVVGDFNHDGKLDVALAGIDVLILLGQGNGTFQQGTSVTLSGAASSVAAGDFDSDGNLDVALTIPASNTVAVLRGNGDGTLQPAAYYPAGVGPNSIAVGDLNNDRKIDLVIANSTSGDVSVLLGNGDASFKSVGDFGVSGFGQSAAIGDFNGDGAPDIAVATGFRGGVSILTNRGAGPVPAASLAPSLVGFGSQAVGLSSVSRLVTLTNTGSATLNITGISLTGPQATDFSETHTCGPSLATAESCSLSVTFIPSALGNRIASIAIKDNAFGSPQIISLNGTGVALAPSVGLKPASLTFGAELISVASAPQVITLTNTGNAVLTISGITVVGTNAADFGQSNTCPATLAAQGSCAISVKFTPSASGAEAATVSITDNVSNSPQNIPLSGMGSDFSLGAATGPNCPTNGNCSTTAVIKAGQTATYLLQVSPLGGFNGNVTLSCGGAPAPSTCGVSPSAVPSNGSSSYGFTVTITGTSVAGIEPSAYVPITPLNWPVRPLGFVVLACAVLSVSGIVKSHGRKKLLLPALAVLLLTVLDACGGSSGTTTPPQPVNAMITVTGNSGSANRTVQLSLTINP
jgi:hypothetical protein